MKVGTVLSTCIYDIVTGKVPESDVLLILDVVGYDFNNPEDWDRCWYNMCNTQVSTTSWVTLDRNEVKKTITRLIRKQKIHVYRHSSYTRSKMFWSPWLELIIPNEYLDDIPALRDAWEDYIIMAKLNEL